MDYYGDGDSKSYMQVSNVYPGMEITKYECIGHVQKKGWMQITKCRETKKTCRW